MHTLPPALINAIPRIFGETGRMWIDRFPDILNCCVERWNLTLATPFPDLSINYVTNAMLPVVYPMRSPLEME